MKHLLQTLRLKLLRPAKEPTPTPPEAPPTDNKAASTEPAEAAPPVNEQQTQKNTSPNSATADVMTYAKADPQAQLIVVPFGHLCPATVSVSPTSAYTVFVLEGCDEKARSIAAIADDVNGLRHISLTLQTAAQLLVIGHATPGNDHHHQCSADLFFDLLNRVRGNRADHIPMQFPEAHRLLMLAVESVNAAAVKGGA